MMMMKTLCLIALCLVGLSLASPHPKAKFPGECDLCKELVSEVEDAISVVCAATAAFALGLYLLSVRK